MAFDYDVFLSYSADDKRVAQNLARRLRRKGLTVTWDKRKLEQARSFVLCMSPVYFDAEWGTLEHHTLLFRDPTNAQRQFIPLLLADCAPPDIIALFAHIDWRTPSDESYARLLDACRGEEEGITEPLATEEQAVEGPRVLQQPAPRRL